MKVDADVQRKLLDLAEVDAELARIAHRRAVLPELEAVAELEKTLAAKRDSAVAATTALADLDTEIKRQEREIDSVRAREDRDRKLLDSGVGAKQSMDIDHELETLRRRQSALEDDLLELMERREATAAEVQHCGAAVDATERELAEAGERRDQAVADLDTAQARRDAERKQLLTLFPSALLSIYERVREQRGTGAALLRARRCGGCRLELDRSALSAIKEAAADDVLRCEECGVILVRTAESGL